VVAGKVDLELAPVVGREIPDRHALAVLGFVHHGQPLVAGNRRPGGRDHRRGAVAAFRDDGTAPRLEDPEPGVHHDAVFGVLDRDEGAVGGEPGQITGVLVTREAQPLIRGRDRAERLAAQRGQDAEGAVLGADARRDDAVALRDAAGPSPRRVVEEGFGAAALERLHVPGARLVTGVFLPEDHLGPVGGQVSLAHTDRVIRDLSPLAGGDVPAVDLPDARHVRLVHAPIRTPTRPSGQRLDGSAEALLPQRHAVHRRGG